MSCATGAIDEAKGVKGADFVNIHEPLPLERGRPRDDVIVDTKNFKYVISSTAYPGLGLVGTPTENCNDQAVFDKEAVCFLCVL